MKDITDVEYNDDGQIIDCLSDSAIKDTPEERVRQRFIKILQPDYGYPKDCILRDFKGDTSTIRFFNTNKCW